MSTFLKPFHKSECLGTRIVSTFDKKKMSICANSLWDSCNSRITIEAHSLRSHQLADHFPRSLLIKADLDPFKTKVLEHLCPGFVKHSHKSHLREHSSELVSSIRHKQFNRFLYLEIIHVSDQLRSDQITIIYQLSSLMYYSSSKTYRESLII